MRRREISTCNPMYLLHKRSVVRLIVALLGGCAAAVTIAIAATLAARLMWPDYADAEPAKTYTLIMLIVRLVVGVCCVMGGAGVTATIARNDREAGWWLGGLFLALSLPEHLYRVWADYPPWYHILYLAYLVPLAGLTGRWVNGRAQRSEHGARSPSIHA